MTSTLYHRPISEIERHRLYEGYDAVTKRYLWPPGINATGRRMLFTGPDGIVDQKVKVHNNYRYVGIGTMSPEGTSELDYLYRPSTVDPPSLRPKHRRVGEIGWGIPRFADLSVLGSRRQITRGEFRQSAEDRHTHLYQNPWTPPPNNTPTRHYSSRPATAFDTMPRRNLLPSIQKIQRPSSVMEESRYRSTRGGFRDRTLYESSTSDEYL